MDNQDKYFKGQQKQEEFILFFRKHWITLLKEFVYFSIFVVIIIVTTVNINVIKTVLVDNTELKLIFIMAFILSTAYLHRFFLKIFNHFIDIGIVTDIRLIDHKKTLFFRDTMEAIDMGNIQDIEQRSEGFLPNILGYGNIKIDLNAASATKTFRYVPNSQFHFRLISRQKELRQRTIRDSGGLSGPNKPENKDVIEQQRQIILEEKK